jgi:hypothetical protein
MGMWDDVAPGISLVKHDNEQDRFSVILRGYADVLYRETKIAELGAGQFVGGIDLRADDMAIDVVVRKSVRAMRWPRGRLRAFLAQSPGRRPGAGKKRGLRGPAAPRHDALKTKRRLSSLMGSGAVSDQAWAKPRRAKLTRQRWQARSAEGEFSSISSRKEGVFVPFIRLQASGTMTSKTIYIVAYQSGERL